MRAPGARGRRIATGLVAAVVVAASAVLWVLSSPDPLPATAIPAHRPDLANGETMFHAGSCGSCHRAAGAAADGSAPSGGEPFRTPVGTFYPGNLTPDPETGLGAWSEAEFVNAMTRGLSPHGRHYFPAFPYTSFRWMRLPDLLDLRAYLMSLPAVSSPPRAPSIPLAPLLRRGVGLWNRLAHDTPPAPPSDPARGASWNRGAYLVNAPGHCGECHTPRNALMLHDRRRLHAGGPHPGGEGRVPSLRGLLARKRYRDAADLTFALRFGETYGYDKLSSGGMGEIQQNLGKLPEAEVRAMADYLVSLD